MPKVFFPDSASIYLFFNVSNKYIFILWNISKICKIVLKSCVYSSKNLATVSIQYWLPMLPSSCQGDMQFIQETHISRWDQGNVPIFSKDAFLVTLFTLQLLPCRYYRVSLKLRRVHSLKTVWVLMFDEFISNAVLVPTIPNFFWLGCSTAGSCAKWQIVSNPDSI